MDVRYWFCRSEVGRVYYIDVQRSLELTPYATNKATGL